jgi:hypothetical protein
MRKKRNINYFAQKLKTLNCGTDSETQQWCAKIKETDFLCINSGSQRKYFLLGNVTDKPRKISIFIHIAQRESTIIIKMYRLTTNSNDNKL